MLDSDDIIKSESRAEMKEDILKRLRKFLAVNDTAKAHAFQDYHTAQVIEDCIMVVEDTEI